MPWFPDLTFLFFIPLMVAIIYSAFFLTHPPRDRKALLVAVAPLALILAFYVAAVLTEFVPL